MLRDPALRLPDRLEMRASQLALHGRIAAVSETYQASGKLRFSLLPSDASFKPGRNDIQIFLVTGPVANPTLHKLSVTLS